MSINIKRRWITGPAIAMAAVLSIGGFWSPASAATPPGTGVVTGTVTSTGVPVTPPPPGTVNCNATVNAPPKTPVQSIPFSGLGTGFTFNSTVISGTVNVNGTVVSGTVAVTANGAGCDNADFGHGSVNATCGASVGVIKTGPKAGNTTTISCNLSGTYDRIGTHVWVNLSGTICVVINGVTVCATVKVDVDAEFVPVLVAPCAGYPECVTLAAFAGVYVQN